jgi:hypothetical protein
MKMNVETTQDKQMRERMQVDVDLNGQGWMAVSCNTDDGKQFVGVLLQANRSVYMLRNAIRQY